MTKGQSTPKRRADAVFEKAASVESSRLASSPPDTLPLDGYTRWDVLKTFVPFSRETLRKRELAGQFPRRVRLTLRCCAWSNRELHRWFKDPAGYSTEI